MSLARFTVSRPVLTLMVTLIVMVLGLVATARLPIDLLPEVEMPTLSVRTGYENASPEVVERLVTQIVEEIVATVPGVEEIESVSAEGTSSVRVTFGWGIDLDAVTDDVRDRLDREANEFPEDADRPQIRKFDVASFPVVILGVSSDLDPVALTEVVDTQVQYRFERIPGVASVDLWGGYDREIRVELDPGRLQALGLPLDQVTAALRASNVDLPAGEILDGNYEVTLRTPAEYASLDEIEATVVAMRGDDAITIGQIATVADTHQDISRIVRVNGRRGLRLGVRKQGDANTVEVAEAILAEVERVNRDFPEIEVVSVIDTGSFIERSIANVTRSVLYGGILAVCVLLVFLRDLRTTGIIAVAIPISVLATLALLDLQGLSLNLMTLGGLALGVGLMVDNSIVVVDNVTRRRDEEGDDARGAAVAGTNEVASALVASTLTTLVIFLPLAFVEGVSGVLFRELALVIVFALACSLAVALGLVPMLSSRWMRARSAGGSAASRLERWAGALEQAYLRTLRAALRRPRATTGTLSLLVLVSLTAGTCIGTEFLPPSDEGEVRVTGEMEIGTRLEVVDRQTRRIEEAVVAAVPEMHAWVTSIGPSGFRPDETSEGEVRISLGPARERRRSNTEIAADMRRRLDGTIPGMVIRTRAPQGQFVLERILGSEQGITIEVRGFDFGVLDGLAARAVAAVSPVDGVTDVEASRSGGVPQRRLHIDRAKAASLGLTVRDVAEVLETAVAGTQAGDFRAQGNSHRILVRLADARQRSLDEILDLSLTTRSGRPVALRNLVEVESGRGPVVIDRKDQQRLVTIAANVAGRDLGSVAADLRAALDDIPRPAGYELLLSGSVEEQQGAFRELSLALLLSLLLVYMVLAGQYESFRDPFVVMVAVPGATIGVVAILLGTGTTLNIQSGMGCMMLGGIVVNNAILIVDQASRLRLERHSAIDAVIEAGRRRLRPVLMTTLTTVLAVLPLALGIGEGADAQAPLARAVLGGLATSTLVVLVCVPVVYTLVHRDPPAEALEEVAPAAR